MYISLMHRAIMTKNNYLLVQNKLFTYLILLLCKTNLISCNAYRREKVRNFYHFDVFLRSFLHFFLHHMDGMGETFPSLHWDRGFKAF